MHLTDDERALDFPDGWLQAWQEADAARRADSCSRRYVDLRERGPWLSLPGRDHVLLATSLTELANPDWGVGAGIGWEAGSGREPSPQLVWPEDHAWIVATEIDWDSTIVAGTSALIDDVLADPSFESFEVVADDALSLDRDVVDR